MQRVALLFVLFAAGWILLDGTAQASTTSVRIIAGPLSMSSPTVNAVASVPLDGTAQATSIPLNDLTVTDATGTGTGWHLAVQATPLSTADGHLPPGSLRLSCPGLNRADRMTPGHLETTANACLIDTDAAVMLADATPGDGSMGSFSSQGADAIFVNVPADTPAGNYSSTVFISLITGP